MAAGGCEGLETGDSAPGGDAEEPVGVWCGLVPAPRLPGGGEGGGGGTDVEGKLGESLGSITCREKGYWEWGRGSKVCSVNCPALRSLAHCKRFSGRASPNHSPRRGLHGHGAGWGRGRGKQEPLRDDLSLPRPFLSPFPSPLARLGTTSSSSSEPRGAAVAPRVPATWRGAGGEPPGLSLAALHAC